MRSLFLRLQLCAACALVDYWRGTDEDVDTPDRRKHVLMVKIAHRSWKPLRMTRPAIAVRI